MKTREQMLEEGRAAYEEWLEERYFRSQEALLADFAIAQMRPLEARIAELDRQLAVAVEALEWVPVNERLPEQDVMVAATIIDRSVHNDPDFEMLKVTHGADVDRYISYTMWFKGDRWYDTDADGSVPIEDVIAWRRLPEPYTGEALAQIRGGATEKPVDTSRSTA